MSEDYYYHLLHKHSSCEIKNRQTDKQTERNMNLVRYQTLGRKGVEKVIIIIKSYQTICNISRIEATV
ncbi:hypothetical protein Y032_0065g3629 [Ancylostoma ceylanicum]|uniref:Uncharacterized protein n=1 Tax=Ancylostoma ceylanicum TaxID=53326 RepID=A0A016U0I7_9BILA|nr:hypothetical protein Y032_0065g3629 [Ancylostoma ceylanicum]